MEKQSDKICIDSFLHFGGIYLCLSNLIILLGRFWLLMMMVYDEIWWLDVMEDVMWRHVMVCDVVRGDMIIDELLYNIVVGC